MEIGTTYPENGTYAKFHAMKNFAPRMFRVENGSLRNGIKHPTTARSILHSGFWPRIRIACGVPVSGFGPIISPPNSRHFKDVRKWIHTYASSYNTSSQTMHFHSRPKVVPTLCLTFALSLVLYS